MNRRDMTVGPEWKEILLFSLPIMAGQFLQQLYNTVDTIVVGQYVGTNALAAVGTTSPRKKSIKAKVERVFIHVPP